MNVEQKLEELGLTLPDPPKLPPGVQLSFAWDGFTKTVPTSPDRVL